MTERYVNYLLETIRDDTQKVKYLQEESVDLQKDILSALQNLPGAGNDMLTAAKEISTATKALAEVFSTRATRDMAALQSDIAALKKQNDALAALLTKKPKRPLLEKVQRAAAKQKAHLDGFKNTKPNLPR